MSPRWLLWIAALPSLCGCVDEAIVAKFGDHALAALPDGCWHWQDLDPVGTASFVRPALAFAPDGTPWIAEDAVLEGTDRLLRLIDHELDDWRSRVVSSGDFLAQTEPVAIALGEDGAIHLLAHSFEEVYPVPLLSMLGDGAQFRSTTVTTDAYPSPALAIGADGTTVVAYVASAGPHSTALWVATAAADGDWTSELLTDVGEPRSPSIAIDADANIHVAYVAGCPDGTHCYSSSEGPYSSQIVHALKDRNGWHVETITDGANWTQRSNQWIAVDATGRVHLAFPAQNAVKHAVESGQGWQIEDVSDRRFSDGSADVSLAIAADGTLHVLLGTLGMTEDAPDMTWFVGREDRWDGEVIHRFDNYGAQASFAVRPDGVPCVAAALHEQDDFVGRLGYACRCDAP